MTRDPNVCLTKVPFTRFSRFQATSFTPLRRINYNSICNDSATFNQHFHSRFKRQERDQGENAAFVSAEIQRGPAKGLIIAINYIRMREPDLPLVNQNFSEPFRSPSAAPRSSCSANNRHRCKPVDPQLTFASTSDVHVNRE